VTASSRRGGHARRSFATTRPATSCPKRGESGSATIASGRPTNARRSVVVKTYRTATPDAGEAESRSTDTAPAITFDSGGVRHGRSESSGRQSRSRRRVRHTPGGRAVATLNLATTETGTQDGQRQEKPSGTAWCCGNRPRACSNAWSEASRSTSKAACRRNNGTTRTATSSTTEIKADRITLLGAAVAGRHGSWQRLDRATDARARGRPGRYSLLTGRVSSRSSWKRFAALHLNHQLPISPAPPSSIPGSDILRQPDRARRWRPDERASSEALTDAPGGVPPESHAASC
jgi:hypothetical protein